MEKIPMRLTYQRKVILEELKKLGNHPTVDEVYMSVKERLPKISMSTVYRSLDVLSKNGFIRKLEPVDIQKRFDENISSHYHFYCTNCGKVKDAPIEDMDPVKKDIEEIEKNLEDKGYKVGGYVLEFFGICKDCQNNE